MDENEIQALAGVYADVVIHDKIGVIMAVRAYGACIAAGKRPSLQTVERFYEAIKYTLDEQYRTVIHYMDAHDQIALEKAIARRVFDIISDMSNGCVER